jgi:signal peptidase I
MESPSGLAGIIETVARAPLPVVLLTMLLCTVVRVAAAIGAAYTDAVVQRALQIVADLADAVIYAGILVYFVVRPFVLQTFWIPTESMHNTLLKGDYLIVNKAIYRMRDPKAGEIVVFRAPKEALEPGQPENSTDFIKRCIGTPGQLIEVKRNEYGQLQIYRDGKPVEENYLGSGIREEYKLVKLAGAGLTPMEIDTIKTIGLRQDFPGYLPVRRLLTPGPNTSFVTDYVVDNVKLGRQLSYLGRKLWSRPAEKLPPDYYLMMGDNRARSSDGRSWGPVQRWRIIGRAEFVFYPINRIGLANRVPRK